MGCHGMPWDATWDPTASTKVTKVSPAFSRIGKKMQQRSTKIQLSCDGIDFWIHEVVTTWTLESCGTLAVTKQKVDHLWRTHVKHKLHIASSHEFHLFSVWSDKLQSKKRQPQHGCILRLEACKKSDMLLGKCSTMFCLLFACKTLETYKHNMKKHMSSVNEEESFQEIVPQI